MATITFKSNPVQTNGELPKHHAQAPDFRLIDVDLKERSLKDYKGKRKLIYIVPSLDTDVCSLSTKKFNDQIKSHPEVTVLVVSADLPFAQKRACGAKGIANIITLSTMGRNDFSKDYGILIETGPLAGICARAVIVLDENDHVLYTELVPEISHEPNYDAALKALLA